MATFHKVRAMTDQGGISYFAHQKWGDFMFEVLSHLAHYTGSGAGIGAGRCFAGCIAPVAGFSKDLIIGSSGDEIAESGQGMFASLHNHAEREVVATYHSLNAGFLPTTIFLDLSPCSSCTNFLNTRYNDPTALTIYYAYPYEYADESTLKQVHTWYKKLIFPSMSLKKAAQLGLI